jgi:hypothetical protein
MVQEGNVVRMAVTAHGSLKFTTTKMSIKELRRIPSDILIASNLLFTFVGNVPIPGQQAPAKGAIAKALTDAANAIPQKN